MKKTSWCCGIIICMAAAAAHAGSLLEEVLEPYGRLQQVYARINRTAGTSAGGVEMLSRVWYSRPQRLYVDSLVSDNGRSRRREILSDGQNLYVSWQEQPEGMRAPVESLNRPWRLELERVPGTPMQHLLRLRDIPEEQLPPTDEYPRRALYRGEEVTAVLSLDGRDRPVLLEYFNDPERRRPRAVYRYDRFEEPLPGVWIPTRHRGRLFEGEQEIKETSTITLIAVNREIPAERFDAEARFGERRFVAAEEMTGGER